MFCCKYRTENLLHSANELRLHWGLPWVQSDIVGRSCGELRALSDCFPPTVRTSWSCTCLLTARAVPPELAVLWKRPPKRTWRRRCSRLQVQPPRHALLHIFLILPLPFIFSFPFWTCGIYPHPTLLWCYLSPTLWSSWQRSSILPLPQFPLSMTNVFVRNGGKIMEFLDAPSQIFFDFAKSPAAAQKRTSFVRRRIFSPSPAKARLM